MQLMEMSSTLAVVFRGPGQVVVESVGLPPANPDDVLIETVTSWISPGTELSFLRGDRSAGDTPVARGDCPFPLVVGYQKVGRIVALGPAVKDLAVGQVVFATLGRVEGMVDAYGGQMKYSLTPRGQIFQIPDNVEPEWFSGAVLTQVGWNCGQRPAFEAGDCAWVLGDGLVGHWAAQTLQSRGARVTLIGRRQERLAKFTARGEDRTVMLARSQSLADVPRDVNESVQVLVDTVGSMASVTAAVELLAVGGHLVCAGYYPKDDFVSIRTLRTKEITLHTPAGWSTPRMEQTIAAIGCGVLQTAPLITHCLPVAEAPRAYDLLEKRADGALGVLLEW